MIALNMVLKFYSFHIEELVEDARREGTGCEDEIVAVEPDFLLVALLDVYVCEVIMRSPVDPADRMLEHETYTEFFTLLEQPCTQVLWIATIILAG